MVNLTNMFRKEEMYESRHKQAVAIGKHPVYWVGPLLEKLYKESQCSLPGDFHANPYFSIYTVPGPIYVPSRLYFFLNPQTSPQVLEIAQQENTVFPESIMVVTSPDRAITKSLFSTISTISQLQPVTDIWLSGVSCEEVTQEEQLILSKKARSIRFDEPCKLPMSFVKHLLRQLSGSVTLQLLRLPGLNLKEIEEDLDEFMESLLVTHPEMESEREAILSFERLTINLDNNQLSQAFKEKWLTRLRRTIIQLSVNDDGNRRNIGGIQIRSTSEDLTEEEINWLIQEQVNLKASSCDLGPSFNADGNQRKFSSTGGKVQEETEKAEKLDASVLAVLCSTIEKVNETQRHEELSLEEINWLIQEEESKNKKTEDPHQDENLKGKKTEEQPLCEILQGKKTEEQPLGKTLQGKKTEEQPLGETLQGKKTEDQPLGEILPGKKTEDQSLDETLKRKKTQDQPSDGTLKRLKYEDKNPDEALKGKKTE